jgi:uncharacterized membrane protein
LSPVGRLWHHTHRHFRARPRLFVSIAVGLLVTFLMPGHLGSTLRAVVGWDSGAAIFLILIIAMAVRATPASMRRRAALEDEAGWVFLILVAGAAFFSMFSILSLLREAKSAGGSVTALLSLTAAGTILLSWLFTHTMFAVHFAHEFYNDDKTTPGLEFPGKEEDQDYWDFLYFSFVIGMTAQVSDVQVLTQGWRRLVLAHSILSFLFNTVVLALSINLLAGFF